MTILTINYPLRSAPLPPHCRGDRFLGLYNIQRMDDVSAQ